jgi:hypothetical protein
MSFSITSEMIDKYLGFLFKLDNRTKKELIIRLTESIDLNDTKKVDLKDLFGAWSDSRTSDEIIRDIRDSRVNNRKIEDF